MLDVFNNNIIQGVKNEQIFGLCRLFAYLNEKILKFQFSKTRVSKQMLKSNSELIDGKFTGCCIAVQNFRKCMCPSAKSFIFVVISFA
jgi:hypothetical protein